MTKLHDNVNNSIDMHVLREIMGDDEELIKDCFSDLIEDLPEMLKEIREAVSSGNASSLDETAHKLKGSLKYLAAKQAADIANRLEAAGKNQKLENTETDIKLLEDECEKIESFVKMYQEKQFKVGTSL